jgi:hypothetical protein
LNLAAYLSPLTSDFYPFKADIIDLEAEARPVESVIGTTDKVAANIVIYESIYSLVISIPSPTLYIFSIIFIASLALLESIVPSVFKRAFT